MPATTRANYVKYFLKQEHVISWILKEIWFLFVFVYVCVCLCSCLVMVGILGGQKRASNPLKLKI